MRSDYGDLKVCPGSTGAWSVEASAFAKSGYLLIGDGTEYSLASSMYYGYGFQLWAPTGPTFGKANLYVDGSLITLIDYYAAAGQNASMVYQNANLPLGQHLVQLQATHTKNARASDYRTPWDALKVMR